MDAIKTGGLEILLSVIVPAYKFENYITQCVRSILDQKTDFNFEVIVRDDYSGDLTNDILKREFESDSRPLASISISNQKIQFIDMNSLNLFCVFTYFSSPFIHSFIRHKYLISDI